MMKCPLDWEIYRRPLQGFLGDRTNGHLVIPKRQMTIVFSDGGGWEHVSVSHPDRCPSYEEMDEVKQRFWADSDCVMQLHVPRSDHRNCHPYCLHLWRPLDAEIPRPPGIMVAPASLSAPAEPK
jgi:hypothetical protein